MTDETTQPNIGAINLQDYQYDLPEECIAKFPLDRRDQSKLLLYQKGKIQHESFKDITSLIPSNSTLFFNDTKVIPARLHFVKETGAQIEIFLLKPILPLEVSQAMEAVGQCQWQAMIGNLKRWSHATQLYKNLSISGEEVVLQAELIDKNDKVVKLTWTGSHTFGELLDAAGKVPLPPYLKREVTPIDRPRYQTIYSANRGAVAAPTAGLHFTKEIIAELRARGVKSEYLTLHVSAATFRPIKESQVAQHAMHSEKVSVTRDNLKGLVKAEQVIAVGTTSMRTLESLYWYGVKLGQDPNSQFHIEKLFPYRFDDQQLPTLQTACQRILDHMKAKGWNKLGGTTEIFIFPGYCFRACQGLITNFHLPGSTLILLVAAFIGPDWKIVYKQALKQKYRFLSYGDSSLLLP